MSRSQPKKAKPREPFTQGDFWMLVSIFALGLFVYWMFEEPVRGILWWVFG